MHGFLALAQIGILIFALLALILFFSRQHAAHHKWREFLASAQPVRQLSPAEKAAITRAFKHARLRSDAVYVLEGAASTHSLSTNYATDTRLLIAGMEVRLFPQWALYVQEHNRLEVAVAKRGGAAIPISMNGVSLAQALERKAEHKGVRYTVDATPVDTGDTGISATALSSQPSEPAATAEAVERSRRTETAEETVLRLTRSSNNAGAVLLLAIGLAGLLGAALLPPAWQIAGLIPGLLAAWAIWKMLRTWRAPRPGKPITLRTLSGPLGLMQTSSANDRDPTLSTHLCIGQTPLEYPQEWKIALLKNPQGEHRVEVTDSGRVVRHDALSLYDQKRSVPVVRWGRYLALVIGAVPLLAASFLLIQPVAPALQAAMARMQGQTRVLAADSPEALRQAQPRPGDLLTLQGTAQCFGGTAAADHDALQAIMRDEGVLCQRLGWLPGDASALKAMTTSNLRYTLPPAIAQLLDLAGTLAPVGNTYSDMQSQAEAQFRQFLNTISGASVNFNQLALHTATICPTASVACTTLETDIAALTQRQDWPAALKLAQDGKLPTAGRVDSSAAGPLSDDIIGAVSPAMQQEQLKLLDQWRSAHTAPLYLNLQGTPAEVHSDLPPGLLERLGSQDVTGPIILPVIQMAAFPFKLQGEMVARPDAHGGNILVIRSLSALPSAYTAIAPALIFVLALLLLAWGAIGLLATWPRRAREKAATQEYVLSRLGI